jgi:hypothetical protein
MLNRDEDILKAAENWQKAGHGVALATVVETWGSAPRARASSSMTTARFWGPSPVAASKAPSSPRRWT